MPLSEIKSYALVLSFRIRMMKRKTLQTRSLKHSIKKHVSLFRANRNYSSWTGGVISPSLPLLATRLMKFLAILFILKF